MAEPFCATLDACLPAELVDLVFDYFQPDCDCATCVSRFWSRRHGDDDFWDSLQGQADQQRAHG